jgi:hypothetical protein
MRQAFLLIARNMIEKALKNQENRELLIEARETIDEMFRAVLDIDTHLQKKPVESTGD